ncbi:hypothetical protein Tbd_2618 [Thiobacillus denitrificans ATCC 25259]|uniref:Uncharacterized protein n=1 Tax=Thiobacillus denitrificans (strain ATCC 25259 / T1) TaxID=292415 RepID=Q3SFN5_THIDA|nr:hypothetical protein Tbd_2618 [Thiobacillus denitrificans ATCC 25259]
MVYRNESPAARNATLARRPRFFKTSEQGAWLGSLTFDRTARRSRKPGPRRYGAVGRAPDFVGNETISRSRGPDASKMLRAQKVRLAGQARHHTWYRGANPVIIRC